MAYKSVSKVFESYKQPMFVKILIVFTLFCNVFCRITKDICHSSYNLITKVLRDKCLKINFAEITPF